MRHRFFKFLQEQQVPSSPASLEPYFYAPVEKLVSFTDVEMMKLVQSDVSLGRANLPVSVQAASYHMSNGGQRLRMRLALQAGISLGLSAIDASSIAGAVELLHNATIIHDDVQDRGLMRRGRASVWSVYGDNVAICAGDLLLSAAYASLSHISKTNVLPALMLLLHTRSAQAIAGQCADLASAKLTTIDLAAYEQIAIDKSGALLSLPLELSLTLAGYPNSCALALQAAESFSIGYQIVDDLDDSEEDSGQNGRPTALNFWHIFNANGYDADSDSMARATGLMHLRKAADAALQLPMRSGALLRETALRLSARL